MLQNLLKEKLLPCRHVYARVTYHLNYLNTIEKQDVLNSF